MELETYAFSADIDQLLSLIINTVYTNKEVFLRELVSNSSDALNKIRYQSLTEPNVLDTEQNLEIRISFDKINKILIIKDTGIGMTKDELINNLGTIASSGTKKFIESLNNKDLQLIGQFGVGFYSAFLVSNNVSVVSKNNNDDQYIWESTGTGTFTIQKDENDYGLTRGTLLMLHLKDDMQDYLDENKVSELIKKHNQFIDFPIYIENKKTDDNTEVQVEYNQVNKEKPLWLKNTKDVSEDEYNNFYKSLTGDHDTPLDYSHFNVEGQVEFKGLLFVPKRSPYDLFDGQTKRKGLIKLYVRKVFITDELNDLVPEYMKFVSGVIETDDIPLNLSRETLQHNKLLKVIGKNVVKKVIDMFNHISDDADKFRVFYENFNKSIKLGIHEDTNNKLKLCSLLRYETTKSDGDLISFDDYIENFASDQDSIYYITGESIKNLSNSPFLEKFRQKSYEVIYMTDPLDEYITQQVNEYKDKKLVCVTKENINIGNNDSDKEELEKAREDFKPVCNYIKTILGDEIEKVVVSNKLAESPCILSTSEFGWTANMQRIVKAQTFNKPEMSYMMGKKVLEINPNNNIILKIRNAIDTDQLNSKISDLVYVLYYVSLQSSGFQIEDPSDFRNKIFNYINELN